MKRLLSVCFCAIVLVCLCACSAEKTYVLAPFKSEVSFAMNDITVKGTLDFVSSQDITFTVNEPENISGIVFAGEEISYEDIKIGYGNVADSSPVSILFEVICHIADKEIQIPLEGEFIYSGVTESAGYKIIFDCEKGKIISIEAGKFIYNFE